MALRRWQTSANGCITLEGIQTGDGRVWADGAFSWAPCPLPLAWMSDGTQHVDLSEMAPEIGTVEEITRGGDGRIQAWGYIDDEIPEGAELIRRMEAGSSNHGSETFVSIDGDNWAIEIIAMDGGEDEVLLAMAGRPGELIHLHTFNPREQAAALIAAARAPQTAAAGDPDPGPGGGEDGVLLFEEVVDSILVRFTALRIRGLTCVATPAFEQAFIELGAAEADDGGDEEPEQEEEDDASAGVRDALAAHSAPALSRRLLVPDAPAAEVFLEPTGEPNGSLNLDDYRMFGYVALWDSCHAGYTDRCVPPPREDAAYRSFRVGGVQCEGGELVPTGAFTWGIPHASLDLDMLAAFDHYADSRHGFGDAAVGVNEHGIWHAGALRPATRGEEPLTVDDARVLRALSLSGDWRYNPRTRQLSMIAALAVNHPAFAVPRLVASSRSMASAAARRAGMIIGEPLAAYDGERITALVAAGMAQPVEYDGRPVVASTGDCSCHSGVSQLDRIESTLAVLDARTKHLVSPQAQSSLERIRAHR